MENILYHYKTDWETKIQGPHKKIYNTSNLIGNCTNLEGNCISLSGDCTGFYGNGSGIILNLNNYSNSNKPINIQKIK